MVEGMVPSAKAFEWWLGNYLSYPNHLALVIITICG